MRIRKNAKLSPLLFSSHASAPEVLQSHVCQLNQSPWDVIPFAQDSNQVSIFVHFLSTPKFIILSITRRSVKTLFADFSSSTCILGFILFFLSSPPSTLGFFLTKNPKLYFCPSASRMLDQVNGFCSFFCFIIWVWFYSYYLFFPEDRRRRQFRWKWKSRRFHRSC